MYIYIYTFYDYIFWYITYIYIYACFLKQISKICSSGYYHVYVNYMYFYDIMFIFIYIQLKSNHSYICYIYNIVLINSYPFAYIFLMASNSSNRVSRQCHHPEEIAASDLSVFQAESQKNTCFVGPWDASERTNHTYFDVFSLPNEESRTWKNSRILPQITGESRCIF